MLVCYIRLLYDQSFRLFLHKQYTCYSVPYYQFPLYFQRLPRRLLGVLLNTPKASLQRGTVALPTSGPVGCCCRMHLCRVFRSPPKCPLYNTKQSVGEVPVMLLELWGMRSTPSLPLLPGPLQRIVVEPDRVLSMG